MRQIWKFPLTNNVNILEGPFVATNMSFVGVHNDEIYFWTEVLPGGRDEKKTILIIGTGYSFDPIGKRYLGTVIVAPFVWHIYEEISG